MYINQGMFIVIQKGFDNCNEPGKSELSFAYAW